MSDQLYLDRLWWDGHRRNGFAAWHGMGGLPINVVPADLAHACCIDYAPAVDVYQIQEPTGKMRDMNEVEKGAALAFLKRLFCVAPGEAAA